MIVLKQDVTKRQHIGTPQGPLEDGLEIHVDSRG